MALGMQREEQVETGELVVLLHVVALFLTQPAAEVAQDGIQMEEMERLPMGLLAAHALWLAAVAGQERIHVGM
jgi:hypothetical protein